MRVGINIPNHLHRRSLEPIQYNTSTFRKSVERPLKTAIRCYEKAVESLGNEDIVKAMDRTWNEQRELMAVLEVDWGMCGLKDAESWVSRQPV